MALASAGIEMYDLVSSCAVAQINSEVLLDPTLDEESKQTGSVTLAFMPSLNEVTHLHQQGVRLL
jgi:exosome complex component MTR3